jgi:sulfur carrier protein ThiS
VSLVKLILRDKEYEVKSGMTLLSALQKINVVPESVIATREGEMILEDEILKDGDVVKLIAVISGGSYHCEPLRAERSRSVGEAIPLLTRRLLRHSVPRNDSDYYEM